MEERKRKKPVRVINVGLRNECWKVINAMDWCTLPIRTNKAYVTAVTRANFVFYVWFGDQSKEPEKFSAALNLLGAGLKLHAVSDIKQCMDLLRKYEVEFAKVYTVE